jgi:hypothetical protein
MTADARTLDERCEQLLNDHPLAVETGVICGNDGEPDEEQYIIELILPGPQFAQIWRAASGGSWKVAKWDPDVPDGLEHVVAEGVPLPRDGSLFGYAVGEKITALVAVYTDDEPPAFSVMPHAGEHSDLWPLFTGQPVFGQWFWDLHRDGCLVNAGPLVAANPGAVFWADTTDVLGYGCCAVARDVGTEDGVTLQAGVYAYYRLLEDGTPLPSLETLLAGPGLTDLAPRFRTEDA